MGDATLILTYVSIYGTNILQISLTKDATTGVLVVVERERFPRAEPHTPFPGGFGKNVRPALRPVRGCTRWTGTGGGG
jgi:hypothetical protein